MAEVTVTRMRKLWFQVHKWIGLLLALAIIPLSLSGAALVWHDWLDETLNPQRYAVSGEATLAPSAYVSAAKKVLPQGALIATLRYPGEHGPVMVNAVDGPAEKGRTPARINVWLDPPTARVLDIAGGNDGLVRFLHQLHGSFQIPGFGRQVVGWVGVAMLLSALSGLWLWWPAMGRWTRGLRWKRARNFDANLHHQMGFWIAIPLAMLSFTGIWISFPQFFASLTMPAAEQAQAEKDRAQRFRATPLATPRLAPDAAVRAAGGGQPVTVAWPSDKNPKWRISLGGTARGDYEVDDATGTAAKAKAGGQSGVARLMRRLHDGTGMGPVWQTIIFLGGILPAALAVTGIIMWARARKWRGDLAERQKVRRAVEAA
jgi:uncharacterized iron-regulated membrane protein